MSLRAKILLLFAALAIAPILAVGILDYMHSIHALDQLVRAKVEGTTEHAAREIADRHGLIRSDAQRLAEQPASARLIRATVVGDETGAAMARAALDRLHLESWPELRHRFASIELVDPWGGLVHRFADADSVVTAAGTCPDAVAVATVEWPIFDGQGRAGTVVAVPRLEALLPFELLEYRYGSGGQTFVVSRETGAIVHARNCESVGRPIDAVLATLGLAGRENWWRWPKGQFAGENDRFASFVSINSPPWTVATTASLSEFTVPYARIRAGYLLFVLFIALGAAGAFSILLTGVMRSLRQLGSAADRIGEGDFNPWLPPPTRDEVGRLSMAIALMVDRLRQSLRQIELSRQMAAVGKMAAYLAHEIRNPLSSIRLNLQALVRDTRAGDPPDDLPEVLELCLKEVRRLDTAVDSVLALSRPRDQTKRPSSIHVIMEESLELLGHQLERRGVAVDVVARAPQDLVAANAEQVKGVLLNLLLNAASAMPDGGRVRVWTEAVDRGEAGRMLALHVRDQGAGVPPELRERIFEPFFTTRRSGTGIGLPLSLQIAEEHGGRFYLADSDGRPGAEFVLELRLLDGAAAEAGEAPEGGDDAGGERLPAVLGVADAEARTVELTAGALGNGDGNGNGSGTGRKQRKVEKSPRRVRETK